MKRETQALILARRGLTLPQPTRTQLSKAGIWSNANLSVERQLTANRWVIRGEESGGAIKEIGHYVGFSKEDGSSLGWLHPVNNFMPNGIHAIVVVPDSLVRFDLYRFETSYDLLITKHWLKEERSGAKPKLWNEVVFFSRYGILDRELSGKDKIYRGGAAPKFFGKNGEELEIPKVYEHAIFKMVEAVTCIGCRHQHLLEPALPIPVAVTALVHPA